MDWQKRFGSSMCPIVLRGESTMKSAIILFSLFAPAVFAQNPPGPPPIPRGAIAVASPTFGFISGRLIGGAAITGQPYSAEAVTETTQTLADGTHISNQSSSMIYRDSEGRERRENTI